MSLRQDIIARVLAGMRPCDIARELNCARATVYDYIWKARVGGDPIPHLPRGRQTGTMTISLSPHLCRALQPHADQRGIDVQELAILILQVLVQGTLVDAVLDDLDREDAA